MNNNNQQIEQQFLPRHTEYIRVMSDRTGRSYRELEAEWKKATREFEFERMRDPLKYINLKRTDGTVAQEISRRFEETVIMPEQTEVDEAEELENNATEEDMADNIEENILDETEIDVDDEFNEVIEIDDEPVDEEVDSTEVEISNEGVITSEDESEAIPNKSLEQQRQMERPSEETATTSGEVNEKDS